MISINTNLGSMIVQNSLNKATLGLNNATERMTTGYKINHAKDNAANYSINTNLSTKISSFMVAEDNVAMGLDLLTTASDSLNQIDDKLARLRALAEQAANGTYGEDSLKAINSEANAIVDEIQRLYSTTSYNGISLFNGELNTLANNMVARAATEAPPKAGANGFIAEVVKDTPQVTVSDPTKLAEAIANNSIIGISNAETLAELATIVNNGNNCSGKTIVLTNDIDLGDWCADHADEGGWTPIGYYYDAEYIDLNGNYQEIGETMRFSGTFNGNGHKISNLYINRDEDYFADKIEDATTIYIAYVSQGLFGSTNGEIKNVGLENVDVTGYIAVGGLAGWASGTITNSYATGDVTGNQRVGGLAGYVNNVTITNSYATGDVTGNYEVGGLAGWALATITNSYATGDVTGNDYVGGLAGYYSIYSDRTMSNIYATGKVVGNTNVGSVIGYVRGSNTLTIEASEYYSSINPSLSAIGQDDTGKVDATGLVDKITPPQPEPEPDPIIPVTPTPSEPRPAGNVSLQVGINGDSSSQISFDSSFDIGDLSVLRQIGLDTTTDYLSEIDNLLKTVSGKQTEYGAAQNRLESALEQISVSYENLVSSQSTIRDADIAKESSEFIRNQILQQAAATLMATANQTPAIALQLI